jgi:hypothetical protein
VVVEDEDVTGADVVVVEEDTVDVELLVVPTAPPPPTDGPHALSASAPATNAVTRAGPAFIASP